MKRCKKWIKDLLLTLQVCDMLLLMILWFGVRRVKNIKKNERMRGKVGSAIL